MTDDKKMNTGGWGYLKVATPFFRILAPKRKKKYLCIKPKTTDMKHGKEMLEIVGYSLALIIHMVLIMQLAVLLNKSLNIL